MSFTPEEGRVSRLTDLTIPDGTKPSNFLSSDEYSGFDFLTILAPDLVFIGAISVQVNTDPSLDETNDAQWRNWDGGVIPGTILVLTQNEALTIPAHGTHGLRLNSASNETNGPLVFQVYGNRRTG